MKHKILFRFTPTKKVEISDIVSPKPSRQASKVLKSALEKSYMDQQMVREKATAIRSS